MLFPIKIATQSGDTPLWDTPCCPNAAPSVLDDEHLLFHRAESHFADKPGLAATTEGGVPLKNDGF
jgi:hypothetical protein